METKKSKKKKVERKDGSGACQLVRKASSGVNAHCDQRNKTFGKLSAGCDKPNKKKERFRVRAPLVQIQ